VELDRERSDVTKTDLGAVTHRQATMVGVQFHHLGGYEFEGELARGGMGMVFRAWQRALQRHVALKLMLPDQVDSKERVRRFKLEAEATARLEHPNIVPIYEIGEIEGQHFLCMKLIQGETLAHALAKGRFDPRRACEFMATLADAVHYAHQRGVLHRDLKPGNVLVDERGQPQITDFGLARLLEEDQELTRSNAVLGTPGYMSPEQAAGRSKDLTTASDIHALGAILYELLTGQAPFRADSVLETLRLVRECEAVPLRVLEPGIPLDLDTLCRKCLHKDAKERYATAQALADDLRRFLRGDPVMARPLTPMARTVRWCRRNMGITALLAGILTLLVLFSEAALYERKRVLLDKRSIARLVVNQLEDDLAIIGARVEEEAARLRPRLASGVGDSGPFAYTNELRQMCDRPQLLDRNWATITNWVLTDGRGKTLGRWPGVEPADLILDRGDRDYFRGATNEYYTTKRAAWYASAAYDSQEDRLRKIGVSVVIPGPARDQIVGVLTAMVFTTSAGLAASFDIPNHDIVLVSMRDPSTRSRPTRQPDGGPQPSWVIHLHPLDHGARRNDIEFPSRWVTRTNLTFYFDPARRGSPAEAWVPWLVGLARLRLHSNTAEASGESPQLVTGGHPKFVVLVQSRDWIAMFLIPGLLLTAAALGVAGWRSWRAERRWATGGESRDHPARGKAGSNVRVNC
jgi:serine/threonine-protein kinase